MILCALTSKLQSPISMNTQREVNFDLASEDHDLLTIPNGGIYDVYGESLAEFKAEVVIILDNLGMTNTAKTRALLAARSWII